MSIIRSILDTDLYKFTTGYAYSKLFPRAWGEFEFTDRNHMDYPEGFDKKLRQELNAMAQLALTREEEEFLIARVPYLPPTYIDFLKGYRFNPDEIQVSLENKKLRIRACGPLYRVTFWETPVLATVSELYFRETGQKPDIGYMESQALRKAEFFKQHNIVFSLFGMRRRYSFDVENRVTELMKANSADNFFGTSNVYLAFRHNLKVSGTHPHEWVQFHGAQYGYKMANYMAMENWIDSYDGDLGTVLTDTYTTGIFLKNFSKKHALLFTSLRHDSGDPMEFTDRVIERYNELRVDPKQKYIVFSDSLNVEKSKQIADYCRGRIGATFGIGTNLTNDVGNGIKGLNIVMKLMRCKMTPKSDWQECIKLSDVSGKHMGDPNEIELAKRVLEIA